MRYITILIVLFFLTNIAHSQNFTIVDSTIFLPQKKKVALLQNHSGDSLILFKTGLAVNTDGIPISYHPYDLRGDSIALNSILNGIFVIRLSDGVNLSVPRPKGKYSKLERTKMASEAYSVIEKWRDANFEKIPDGYKLSWKSVLIESKGKPCIFTQGNYKGFFASATALDNHLTTNLGECNCNNQVDPFVIPALVLAKNGKTKNPVRTYGGSLGDLVIAYNLKNKNLVYAIIGDTGPDDNLGEGSVILNMKLKGTNQYPKKKSDTYNLAISNDILICVLPNTNKYKLERPFTQSNIRDRVTRWFTDQGYANQSDIVDFFEKQKMNFE